MKHPSVRPIALILLFTMFVSMACSFSTPTATIAPTQEQPTVVKPTQASQSTQPQSQATATTAPATGLVTTLDGVQAATIQIQSEGTFVDPQVGTEVNAAGRGSGFLISADGLAITANHVVTGSALLRVWVGGNANKQYDARVVGVSECSDLAVIKVDGSNFSYLQWRPEDPKVGLQVYLAGYPLGETQYAMTEGIISKIDAPGATGWASVNNQLSYTAAGVPGNSGGPVVDANGQVVAVHYASNNANQYFGIGKAEADKVLKDLEAGKDVTFIGVNGEAVTGTLTNGTAITGVWVSSVKSGSPADKAQVKPGDVIVQMEGEVLATDGTMETYCKILRSHLPTDTLNITVVQWDNQQFYEGQLNGRPLAAAAAPGFFGSALGTQAPTSGSTSGTYNYVKVTDDSGSISVEVPDTWTDIDGSAWKAKWTLDNGSQYNFSADSITASTDLTGYNNGYDTPGVFFAASTDLAKIGGYAQLLEGLRPWYQSDCTLKGTYDYSDTTYEGKYDLWTNCGPNGNMVVSLACRPISNPTGFLMVVEVKIVTNADLDALDHILKTFDTTG
jgi:serine protease Do